jgi:hypothetical protein
VTTITTAGTVTLRSADGKVVASLGVLPASLCLGVGLAVAPRLTAMTAIGALLARMSLSLDPQRSR